MGLLALYISNVIVSGIGFEWERIERREEGENGRFKFRTALTGTSLRADKRLWKVVKKKVYCGTKSRVIVAPADPLFSFQKFIFIFSPPCNFRSRISFFAKVGADSNSDGERDSFL